MNHDIPAPQHQTRAEHSRSIEDAEKYKAIATLVDLGMLVPLARLKLHHGRAGNGSDWTVNPAIRNGRGDNVNQNVNQRSTLYTGSVQVARDFADRRVADERYRGRSLAPEIHRIVSEDPDAMVMKSSFSPDSFDEVDKNRYRNALKKLLIEPTAGTPPLVL